MTTGMSKLVIGQLVSVDLDGDTMSLILEDRVYPDRSCGQWTAGFWAFRPGDEDDADAPAFFVEEGGRVYGDNGDGQVREDIGAWTVVL